ncbi:MAG: glycosyltransferase family 4 protein [Desulfatiglandaceae bacterium]
MLMTFDQFSADPVTALRNVTGLSAFKGTDPIMHSQEIQDFVRSEFNKRGLPGQEGIEEDPFRHYAWVYEQFRSLQEERFGSVDYRSTGHGIFAEALPEEIAEFSPIIFDSRLFPSSDGRIHAARVLENLLSIIGRYEQADLNESVQHQRRLLAEVNSVETLYTQIFFPDLVQQMEPYGGILSVIMLVNDLIRLGLDVKVVVLTTKNYHEFPGLLTRPIYFADHDKLTDHFPPADAVVATLWTTVYYMAAIFARHRNFLPFYFVQDYEVDFYPPEEFIIREQIKRTYHLNPYAFAKTPWICEKVRSAGGNITQVSPALDLDLFYPRDISDARNSPKKILTLLRPQTSQRGFETAVRVLKKLHSMRGDIEIHVFGCDDHALEEQEFDVPVVNHGVVNNSDLPDLYSRAYLFAEFSNFHGFGRTIAEAMACGCPCVITDSGGISLFARHKENALIGAPCDVDGLLRHINRLCDDESLHHCLSENARKSVLQFDHMNSSRKTLAFFKKCFKNKSSQLNE